MATFTQPLKDEHKELLPAIEKIFHVADSIGDCSLVVIKQDIKEILTFLNTQLFPHAQAEEEVLYPVVGEILGASGATETMSNEHLEIKRLARELQTQVSEMEGCDLVSVDQMNKLRRVLYSLYAVIHMHLNNEEEVYLPLLDGHLNDESASRLFEMMEGAAREAKSMVH